MSKTKEKKSGNGSIGRIILGTLLIYLIFAIVEILFFWAFSISVAGKSDAAINWAITVIISLLLLSYSYGFLGVWLIEFGAGASGAGGARNPVKRVLGSVFGSIGFILRPFPIMAYGANKKKYLYYTAIIPLVLFGIVSLFIGIFSPNLIEFSREYVGNWSTIYYLTTAVAFLNALLVLSIKKCPKCKCVMSDIDYETVSFNKENYTRERSRQVGTVSYGNGQSADVYEHYNAQYEGYRSTYAKTYTCLNCGTQKQGRKFAVSERDINDI